ncbi:WD40 repeat domain-containing serine/threonine protein kinase [Nonomuraea angiospora]|uniref:WD40 repeat protein n=1 Tax=Nonomuraea angiospora TaxID=46172 RepID=A0ABR9MGZ2_9ACTN|nr:serine/threonine-protein kinase [Nonomuraea angiospora]MBE1591626.1 WD40 repeat protein [Nonomuraea angiospora]
MTPLLPGDPAQLGEYWLAGRLGAGGQGVVYDAYDDAGRRVAVKVIRPELLEHAGARADFVKEVTAARKVASFCTARIIDADLDAPAPYIVSEHIEGPSLRTAVERHGPFDADRLHRLAVGVATALAAIHDADVVHRDLKPGNVLLGPDGPRVIDFGLARTGEMSQTTEGGFAAGTPPYMAPERLAGQRGGSAVDVWAWGAMMLYAATGRSPFSGDLALVRHQVAGARPDFTVLAQPLRRLVTEAMSLDAEARPPARSLLLDLIAMNTSANGPGLSPGGLSGLQGGLSGLQGGLSGSQGGLSGLLSSGSRVAGQVRPPGEPAAPSPAEVAEAVYGRLSPEDQALVPSALLRMVRSDESAETALREAATRDLVDGARDPAGVQRVLQAYTDAGLLVHKGETITLAGAALLRAWPRLRDWVEADRAALSVHHALNRAATVWHANGRRPDDLYRGTVLDETVEWAANGRGPLRPNQREQAFLDASRERSRDLARRRRRVRGTIAALVAVLLAAMGVVAVQNVLGTRQRDTSAAGRVAALANRTRAGDPLTALLLSVAAWRIAPVAEARSAMYASLAQRERSAFRPGPVPGSARFDLSDDGTRLAVLDGGRFTLWDVTTGRPARAFDGVSNPVSAIALSADGRRLAVAGERSISVWDAERGVRVAEFGEGAQRLAFSPRRLLLAATTAEGRVRVWDLTSQRPLAVGDATEVAFSADDALMATTLPGGRIELHDWQGVLARLPGAALAFDPARRELAVRTGGEVRFWDLAARRWRQPVLKGFGARALRFSQDGRYLAAYDGSGLALWSRNGTRLLSHPVGELVAGLRLGPGTLAFGLLDGTVVTLDVSDLTRPRTLAPGVEAGLIDPARRTVIVRRPRVEIWRLDEPARQEALPVTPTAMALSPGGTLLAVGTADPARVTLWNLTTGTKDRTFPVKGASEVGGLAFAPDGTTLAVAPFQETVTPPASNWRDVQLWDVRRGVRTRTLSVPGGSGLVFRPDGRELAVNGVDGALASLGGAEAVTRPFGESADGVRAIAYSPDGTVIATGALAAGVTLWNAADRRQLAHLPLKGFGAVDVLAFSPDGRTLAVGGSNRVQLWDVAERAPLGAPAVYPAGEVVALAFDAGRLRWLRTDGTLGDQPVTAAGVAAALCARAGRSLSRTEWDRLIPGTPYREIC